MSKVIGIDLGTTFSLAAYLKDGQPEVIPNSEASLLTPSVVAFRKNGSAIVGNRARSQAASNPEGTVFSIKRSMGRSSYIAFDGTLGEREVVREIKRHMGSGHRVTVNGREYSPEEISAIILKKLKADSETYLGEKVEKAVISVPAYFNITQRQATIDAGRIAGLDVIRIIDEPTAAALAYGIDKEDAGTILVWDLGGGTFDVSVLELGGGVYNVRSVNGDTRLGGDDYTQRIADYVAEEFKHSCLFDIRGDSAARAALREAAEQAKAELSFKESADVTLLLAGPAEPARWSTTVTRNMFEERTSDLLERMVPPTEQALFDAGLKAEDIDRVILVGGSTRIPQVRRLFARLMGKEPVIAERPDEVVAMGAAIQAGILTGEIRGRILVDVTPISLGIETEGGIFTRVIERNTSIPVTRRRIFTNAADNQTSIDLHVLQGERAMAAHNVTVDRFTLEGVSPLPRGEAMIEVSFSVDSNGVLLVTAEDLHTESSREIKVSPRFYGLPEEEINRMMEEAESNRAVDEKGLHEAELRVRASNMISAGERVLAGVKSAGFEGEGAEGLCEAEAALESLKSAMERKDSGIIEEKSKAFEMLIKDLDGAVKGSRKSA